MAFKIYTKTGDKGTTSLVGGKRVSKFDDRIEAYGTVDELISYVGLVRDLVEIKSIKDVLIEIQSKLMTVSSILATEDSVKQNNYNLNLSDIEFLEKEIDLMDEELPTLTKFILPGGNITVSHCHIARTICRRAERLTIFVAENNYINPLAHQYLNRLSDYLFTLARYISLKFNAEEVEWKI